MKSEQLERLVVAVERLADRVDELLVINHNLLEQLLDDQEDEDPDASMFLDGSGLDD